MSWIDWSIVLLYLGGSIAVGLWLHRRASADITSYFVAGRSMPGWLVGTSMVATTFAADTPLAVTGLVAKHGVAGNWFWWSLAFGHLAAAFVFARWWRRAEVITDAELTELRYTGRSASTLRLLRAFYFAIPINCIIMAWVIRAMGKIVALLFPWDQWLGPRIYGALLEGWPSWIAIKSPSEAISILIGAAVATTYAVLGGLPGVLITDVAQFALAMVGSVTLAVCAVRAAGGLDGLTDKLAATYGPSETEGLLSYLPSSDAAWLPLQVFLVYVLVQWWAQKFSDGGGMLVQRMSAARDEHHALRGTAWFVIAHYVLRPWPWILVGLVSLVFYPLHGQGSGPLAEAVANDREMAYPVLMVQLLPTGLLGVMVAGMAAAFMSTIDTHVTWGASYLVRDVYQRFLKPEATQAQLVRAGRLGIVVILALALAFTTQVNSISGAWKFLTAMGSGLGLATMGRWLWWRVNAHSEIAGMVTGAALALLIYGGLGGEQAVPYHVALLIIVGVSTVTILAATFATDPVPREHLRRFYEKVRPLGAWGPVREASDPAPSQRLGSVLGAWALASGGLFALLFGFGEWLLGTTSTGVLLSVLGAGAWAVALRLAGAWGRS